MIITIRIILIKVKSFKNHGEYLPNRSFSYSKSIQNQSKTVNSEYFFGNMKPKKKLKNIVKSFSACTHNKIKIEEK